MNMEFTSVPRPPRPQTVSLPEPSIEQPRPELPRPVPPKPKRGLKWLVIILCTVLLGTAGAFAWLWQKEKNKKVSAPAASQTETTETETTPAITCASDNKLYENQELKFSFCYPEIWGEPSVADAKLDPSDNGSRHLVSFATKNEVKLGLVSSDWTTTVGRGGVCSDPTPTAPAFADFSTEWKTEGEGEALNFASRGVEKKDNSYFISEDASEFLSGVCLRGIVLINTGTYPQATASYFKEFGGGITSPKAHVDNPTTLVPANERSAFSSFVKSIQKL